MKVIFLEDIPNVAEVGQVKDVADGYGRNYLLPRKLAVLANSGASSIVEAQLKRKAIRQAQVEAEMAKVAKQLEGKKITLTAKVGAKERLYGSITSADIAEELSSSAGLEIDKRKVELDEPIRQLGDYEVTIRLTKDITPKIRLTVVGETEEKEELEEQGEKKEKVKAEKKVKRKSGKKEEEEAKPEEQSEKKEKVKAEKKVKKKSGKKEEEKAGIEEKGEEKEGAEGTEKAEVVEETEEAK